MALRSIFIRFRRGVAMRKIIINLFCFFVLLTASGCVQTQDFAYLADRVAVLERENSRYAEKEALYDKTLPEMRNRLETLEKRQKIKNAEVNAVIVALKQDMRLLKGSIEESEYRLSKHGGAAASGRKDSGYNRLDNAISQNYMRLIRLEEYLGLEPSESLPEKPGTPDVQKNVPENEDSVYKAAKEMLDQGNNEQARDAFETFLKKYPDSENADNARFWIADSYYRDKWYEKAILEYQKVVEQYARGNKVPSAMLKQGYAFSNLGENSNAKLVLKELIKKFPGTREADMAAEKLKKL